MHHGASTNVGVRFRPTAPTSAAGSFSFCDTWSSLSLRADDRKLAEISCAAENEGKDHARGGSGTPSAG
jgi:hypothetical protein